MSRVTTTQCDRNEGLFQPLPECEVHLKPVLSEILIINHSLLVMSVKLNFTFFIVQKKNVTDDNA